MVGGGVGADLEKTHRFEMRLDDSYDLVAGVFGQDPGSSVDLGARLGVAPDRVYSDCEQMAEREAARADGIDLAVVAAPDDSHFVGKITFMAAEHASGWNATALELTGSKQAGWRTDPKIGGRASVVGDLGTHAYSEGA